MYYIPNRTYYYSDSNNNRIAPGIGGFLVPFGLGFLTGPLVFNRPRPYYYQPYYYPPRYF